MREIVASLVALLVLTAGCGDPGRAADSADSLPAPPTEPRVTTPSLPFTDLDRLLADNPYRPDGKIGSVCWVATELTLVTLRLAMTPDRADVDAFADQLPEFGRVLDEAEPNLTGDELAALRDVRTMVDQAHDAVAAANGDTSALASELSKLTSEASGEPLCV